jgi:hypothetical protein
MFLIPEHSSGSSTQDLALVFSEPMKQACFVEGPLFQRHFKKPMQGCNCRK